MIYSNSSLFCPAPETPVIEHHEIPTWMLIVLPAVLHFGGFMLLEKLHDCCAACLDDNDEPLTPPTARPK